METGVSISFGLVDVTAKQDTTAAMPDRKAFIDPQDLSLEGVYAPKVATCLLYTSPSPRDYHSSRMPSSA